MYRLQVLQEAQQKHEELSHAGHTDVIIKDNVEINGGSTKTKLKNDKTKKSTIVTFSDSPLIQEHKVSVSTFFREIVFVNAYYLLSLFFLQYVNKGCNHHWDYHGCLPVVLDAIFHH